MLTLWSDRAECLWEEALPVEVRELPADLAALDRILSDPALLGPIVERFGLEVRETQRAVLTDGRPTIAMETYIRLMVLKQRYRWGYRTLVAEVSDSIHLRRFCRISLAERVPDESTIRKLTRRIGPETASELTRALISKATHERRFRPRAVRIDSTVVEADVKYPTDSGLASDGVRALAREGRKLAERIGERKRRVRDRSRAMGRRLRAITRTIRRRSGEAKAEVLKLTAETGELLERSVGEARKLAAAARRKARGRGAQAKLKAAAKLEQLAERCEKVAKQIKRRVKGEPIADRIVSLSDPDARPIRKGKLGKPNEFGYVTQLAEVTENTKRGARGLIVPAATAPGNPQENALLPATVAELGRLGTSPREVALDGGFMPGPTNSSLEALAPERVFISGRQEPGSRRTNRRLQRYRTGAEGRISHLKRRYGLGRSRLKGHEGQRIWTEWSILAYNADTLAARTR
ncbi:MAG: ISNCY family transposase [Actinobacteria bacterium]|nr:ISNCY family transposase [Actinomycetota bacterium]